MYEPPARIRSHYCRTHEKQKQITIANYGEYATYDFRLRSQTGQP